MDRISTGNPQADLILDGGFPTHSINIIMGEPGVGKTVLAEQLAFANANCERPVLYLTTMSEPLTKAITYLQGFTFADQEKLGNQIVYEDIADALISDPQKLGARLLDLVKRHRPSVIIIDSFKAIADLMPDLPTWRKVLYEVAGLLSAYDTTTFWVGEYAADVVTNLPEFAIADGIIELVREQSGTRDGRYLRVIKLRGSGFRDGYHFFRLTSAGMDICTRLTSPAVSPDYTPTVERLQTGIGGLDEMVETGWLRGTTTLVAGPSGAGKTVLGLHFLREGVRRGEPGLLVGLQENPTQLGRIVQNFGWTPDEFIGPGKLEHLYASSVEIQIDVLVAEVFKRMEIHGTRRVVIDALGDVEKGARDPVRFRDYLYALSQHFAVRNVTTMFLLETVGRPDAGPGPTGKEVSYISDNTLLLEMHLKQEMVRTIRVLKSRGSGHDGRQRTLRITPQGIVVV
jgi:circadian clock protein KaiC